MYTKCALGLCVSAVVFGGCGAKKPPVEPSKPVASRSARIETPAPELTPLAAPRDLIAVARVERLNNASATIARWMSLPFDMRMLDALGPGLSRALMLDAPVEAAVTLADASDTEVPQPYAVFTVGITSAEVGRSMFEHFGRKLEEMSPGVWVTADQTPLTCAIAPALGRAPVRLVCGDRRVDVENLLPYATRGLPLQAMGTSDLHVEFRLAPIRERYGQRLRQAKALGVPMALGWLGISDTRLSRPITDILYALGDELVDVMDDLDHISFDSAFASNPDRVDVSTSLAFSRAHSWSAQVIADSSKRATTAPALFFDLPKDASLASYVTAKNPRLFETVMHRLEALIDGALAHVDVNQKLRDDFIRNLDQFTSQSSAGACGAGTPVGYSGSESIKGNFLRTLNAWQVCVYDALPPSAITALLDSAARLTSDKKIEQVLGAGAFTVRRRTGVRGLPTGARVFEYTFNTNLANLMWNTSPRAKSDKKVSKPEPADIGTLYLYVVPDGTRTWTGFGTDAKVIEAHLLAARTAGAEGRLGASSDLAWFRTAPGIAGGFATMAHVGAMLASRGQVPGVNKSSVEEGLAAAPHHGQIPIPYLVQVRGEPSAPELRLEVRIDRTQFEDLVAIGSQSVLKMAK